MKKINLITILAALLFVYIVPDNIIAYSGGSGTDTDPYQITDVNNLLELSADTDNYNKYFILTADINLEGQVFTTAVIARDTDNTNDSFDGNVFTGIFDGAGHKIINLTIDTNGLGNDYLGLFGYTDTDSEVKNLALENVSITGGNGSDYCGGLVGDNFECGISNCSSAGAVTGGSWLGGLVGSNDYGNISSCFSSGIVGSGNNSYEIGGLAGDNYGHINNCRSTSDVTAGDDSTSIGGLVGDNYYGSINESNSTGTITSGNNAYYLGGLAGDNYYGSISASYSTSVVVSKDGAYSVGGLVGDNWLGNIGSCSSTGTVNTGVDSFCLGGLVGDTGANNPDKSNIIHCCSTDDVTAGDDSTSLGGLVGNSEDSSISNCYSTGTVTGTFQLGGLIGYSESCTISNCFFLDTSGPTNSFGTPLSDTQMKEQSNFTGWDFLGESLNGTSEIWTMPDDGYPLLSIFNGYSPPALTGSGTESDPWLISNAQELGAIYYRSAGHYKLIADIDLGGISWSTAPVPFFSGSFDGNGKKIINLTITGGDNLGLFGAIYDNAGIIQNLGLENASITGINRIGGLAGENNGYISNCYSTGKITGTTNSEYVGGLAGYNKSSIWNCYSTASVIGGDKSNSLGGLTGYDDYGYISNCCSAGNVTGGYDSQYLGGLAGYENHGNIEDCYSIGAIRGKDTSQYLGGLVGYSDNSTITSCFWDITTSGQSTSPGGTGLPTADMKMKSTYTDAGWDCSYTWYICEGVDYPKLRSINKYSGGSGTADDPYQIASACDLLELAENTDDYYGNYFILTADIDIGSYSFTTAVIARDGAFFTGNLDGNGHTIRNLTINTAGAANNYLGLIGCTYYSEIKNLQLENVSITVGNGTLYAGGLVGFNYYGTISNCNSSGAVRGVTNSSYLGGLAGHNSGSISNCSSSAVVTGGANAQYLGGLAGYNYGSISNCSSSATVTSIDNLYNLGGLAGYNSGSISNCSSTSNVSSGDDSGGIGGLTGGTSGNISHCCYTGNVSGGDNSGAISGLAGYTEGGSISNSYCTGTVSGGVDSSYIGGLVGNNYHSNIINCCSTGSVNGTFIIGGLVGNNDSGGNIINCYSTGTVTSGNNSYAIGGLAGDSSWGNISSCYFLKYKGPANGYGTPLTDSQMEQQASFVGWDFVGETTNGNDDIWSINEGADYPKLTWQPSSTIPTPKVKFGTVNGKNIKRTLKDCTGYDVTFSLTGGGYGKIDPHDCSFEQIELFNTTAKSVLTISTKSKVYTSVGSIICYGPMSGISAKTAELHGSIKIGPSSNPKAAVTIVFDQTDGLNIDSNMPIKSISTMNWWSGSINAPSIGSITTISSKKPARWGDLDVDVKVGGVINSVKVAGDFSGEWDCNVIKSITAPWVGDFYLTLSKKPNPKIPALGSLTVKGSITNCQISSAGNIGTVTTGKMINSSCFAGVDSAYLVDVNAHDEVLDLPPVLDDTFNETATIKSIAIKGIKGENPPYFINSNIAAVNVSSVYIAYPEYHNAGVPFGISMWNNPTKTLKIKDAEGTHSWKGKDIGEAIGMLTSQGYDMEIIRD
jgi:hypothetical protein